MHRPEAKDAIHRLVSLYEQLVQISENQLEWIEQRADSPDFTERINEMNQQWIGTQSAIVQLETQLRDMLSAETLRTIFQDRIVPLAEQVKENIDRASRLLKRALIETGAVIRSANEHKHASKAYAMSGYDVDMPIFFDEKK